jgi:hypothetical protein
MAPSWFLTAAFAISLPAILLIRESAPAIQLSARISA